MSSKTLKLPKADIDFTLDGVDGPVKYSLSPLKRKKAAMVFDMCLSKVARSIAGGMAGDTKAEKVSKAVQAFEEALPFETKWFLLSAMMEHGMVNGAEIKNFEESDIFEDNPHHMMLILFHGIRGNWPKVFSKLGAKMSGFVSSLKNQMTEVMEATETDKETEEPEKPEE